jgi:hypothetical protein
MLYIPPGHGSERAVFYRRWRPAGAQSCTVVDGLEPTNCQPTEPSKPRRRTDLARKGLKVVGVDSAVCSRFGVSSMDTRRTAPATPGIVKLLLPPRQSRGNSLWY